MSSSSKSLSGVCNRRSNNNSSEASAVDHICFGEAIQESLMMKPTKLRNIRLQRRPQDNFFGFAIRGGRDYGQNGLGFYITKVVPGSESELQGLEVP